MSDKAVLSISYLACIKDPKVLMLLLYLFYLEMWSCLKCPSSSSYKHAISTEESSFSGFTQTYGFSMVEGMITHSLYYSYWIYTPDSMVIRKINANNTLEWMASFSFRPIEKSLFIDSIEQCLYIGSYTNPLNILRLSPSTGALLDAQTL